MHFWLGVATLEPGLRGAPYSANGALAARAAEGHAWSAGASALKPPRPLM